MAKISKPVNTVTADVSPSVEPDGAGSERPDNTVDVSEPVASIDDPAKEVEEFLSASKATIPYVAELHVLAERLATVAAKAGDQATNGKLSRLANVLAEFRNGLIASLS